MDLNLTLDKYISNLRKICYLELRKIAQIRHYLTSETTIKLVCSFVLSRLDYCNSLLAGLPECKINRLQQIQNNAARLVKRVKKREHITPILKDLHWLPIHFRTHYKILSLTFQCMNTPDFPDYLKKFTETYTPSRQLRSSVKNILVKPRYKLETYGKRTFKFQSADLWNKLPEELKNTDTLASFKSNLKTYLFKTAFHNV